MKILIAVDGSPYTKRTVAYLAAHDEWFGSRHQYTLVRSVLEVPDRAAAFVGSEAVRKFHEETPKRCSRPIRAFFTAGHRGRSFVYKVGHAADQIAGSPPRASSTCW